MNFLSLVLCLMLLQCFDYIFCDVIFREFNQNEGSVCNFSDKTRGVCRKSCPELPKSEYMNHVCNPGLSPELYCCVDKVTAQQYPTIYEGRPFCLKKRLAEEYDHLGLQEQQKVLNKDEEMKTRIEETIKMFERQCYEFSLRLEEDERNNYLSQCLAIQRPSTPNRYYRFDMLSEYHKVAGIGFKASGNEIDWACWGNFIHASYVLTAASCMRNSRNTPNIVRHKWLDLYVKSTDFNILKTFIHPNYEEQSSRNDIAIVKTSYERNRNSNLEIHLNEPVPACLWTKQQLTSEGLIVYDHTDELRISNTAIIPPEKCSKKLSRTLAEDLDSCQNCGFQNKTDVVGSFQYIEGQNFNVSYIVGIGSRKLPCNLNVPALLTHIYPHLQWIESVISN